jgi:hypothetical protein
MKRLKVDFEEIAFCMEDQNSFDHDYYFDTDTGKVVTVSGEVIRAVEDGDEEILDGLPDWQKGEIEIAEDILIDTRLEILEEFDIYPEIVSFPLSRYEYFKKLQAPFLQNVEKEAVVL